MEEFTQQRFDEYTQRLAELNGLSHQAVTTRKFTVDPSIQQTLVTRMQASSDFLGRINVVPVSQLKGQKVGLTMGGSIASNTDTSTGTARKGIDPTGLDSNEYECFQNNYDTALRYAKLDMWAQFPDFQERIRNACLKRQMLDRICVGFNGTSYAKTSNRAQNPLLQDVNIGWLQHIREDAPERHMSEVEGGKKAGAITFGTAGDYDSLDSLVWDIKESLLPEWAVEDPDLVVIVGRKLVHDKYFPLINRSEGSLDMMARQAIMADIQLGGLPVERVPYFPPTGILVTKYDNLSMYFQKGSQRREIRNQSELDQVTDFQSSNDAYPVEDYDYVAFAENIEVRNADGSSTPETGTGS
ncbi:phage major capsid protein, P2 family [Novosphingobium sp.]|uniref:phage major capsid protein, P2 family n=1 Tax=Novosphingobium sp. TaxID=1874826 RepID=UPI0031D9316E